MTCQRSSSSSLLREHWFSLDSARVQHRRSTENALIDVSMHFAPLAQLDRASVYGTEGCWFEPSGVYFGPQRLTSSGSFLLQSDVPGYIQNLYPANGLAWEVCLC